MIDLRYGGDYYRMLELKHEMEVRLGTLHRVPDTRVMLNYGANSCLINIFSALSTESLFTRRRRLRLLVDIPNYFFSLQQLKEWRINAITVSRKNDLSFPLVEFIQKLKISK